MPHQSDMKRKDMTTNQNSEHTPAQQRSEVFGTDFAVKFFAKRGGHSEAHLKAVEVAAIAAFGYQMGASKEGSEALQLRVTSLEGALRKYGRHSTPGHHCAFSKHSQWKCDCGLDDVLATLSPSGPQEA